MKKLVSLLCVLFVLTLTTYAKTEKGDFAGIIRESGISRDSITVSIKDTKNGKTVYSLNDKIMMNPASVQKVLTMTAAEQTLGSDYKFSTELYARGNDSYLLKLSGDPYLRYNDLKAITKRIDRATAKNVFIDDSILDSEFWGEGWQWDDDMNVRMQKFGAYNLDRNLIKLTITPSESGQFAQISNPSKYPLVFMNNVTTSNVTSLDVKRNSMMSDNTIILNGTVARQTIVNIPSNNIKRYFEIRLTNALGENKIYLKNPFVAAMKTSSDTLLESIEHDLFGALNDILKNSNNMAAETVFKLAGGKYKGTAGSAKGGVEMFNNFCKTKNLDSSAIKITDGSGVSKNNLATSDFISEFLYVNKDSLVMNYLPKPGEGTLNQRLLPIRESLKAKTGTLDGTSSIAGYITTKKGNNYAFCIMQNDVKLSASDKKMLEDYIIREIYLKL